MQNKKQSVDDNIDIDQMLQEGEARYHNTITSAQEGASSTLNQEKLMDFSLDTIDCFKFEQKDYREEKKKMRELLEEERRKEREELAT
jgi:hypothetical protein